MDDDLLDEEQPEESGGSKWMLPMVVLVSAGLGVALSVTVIAPRVIAARGGDSGHAEVAAESKDDGGHGGGGGGGGGHGGGGGGHGGGGGEGGNFVELGNMIVNPAGSAGLRFLMATVAIEVHDDDTRSYLRDREIEVRDLIHSVLEHHTMEMLTVPGARDSVKHRVAEALHEFLGASVHFDVFLPQFVLQ